MNVIPARQSFDGPALQIALVNNMPDQAIDATKAQFVKLLRAGAGKVPFRLRCYTLSNVPRGGTARQAIARSHEDIEALYARGADALIVTGSEPRADTLENEPYWDDFARLVDWARVHTISALWSCLATHGAVLRLDGVRRRRATEKISGVFACEVAANDWATRGAAGSILVPHSRYNGLSRSALVERGYHISSWSGDVEVDCFWRREPSLFLFTQGHPEYNADTLAREFRRDALRFLNGERDCFPSPPRNYFSNGAQAALDALRQSADSLDRPRLARTLGQIVESAAPSPTWADDAERLYRNWLELVAFEKMREARADAIA
jgi:homoserine O-succinyltransferase